MTKANSAVTAIALGLTAAAAATTAHAQVFGQGNTPNPATCVNNPGLPAPITPLTFVGIAPTGTVAKMHAQGAPSQGVAATDFTVTLDDMAKYLADAACTKTSNMPFSPTAKILQANIQQVQLAQSKLMAAQNQQSVPSGFPGARQPQNYPSQQTYPQAQVAPPAAPPPHRFGFPSFGSPFTASHLRGQVGASIERDQQGTVQNIQFSYERTLLMYDKASNMAVVLKAPQTIGMLANQQEGFIKKFVGEICDANPPKLFPLADSGRMAEVTIRSATPGAAEVAQLCGPQRSVIDSALAKSPVEAGPPGAR